MKLAKASRKSLQYLILIAGACVFAFPMIWLISTSLKIDEQVYKLPPEIIPNPLTWDNYVKVFRYFSFLKYLGNTVICVVGNILGVCISAPLVAYSFARIRWHGRGICFTILLATMMIPSYVTMIPVYVFFSKIGWLNTHFPLWVPAWFGGGAFNIFLMRQFMMTIPKELEESARIDGANRFTVYSRIILPLVKPTLTTIAIFTFMSSWNDFMGPLLYLNDSNKYTLSLALRLFQQSSSTNTEIAMQMAASTLVTLPVVVFFFLGQKYFIEGVVLTGMKA